MFLDLYYYRAQDQDQHCTTHDQAGKHALSLLISHEVETPQRLEGGGENV